MLENIQTCAVSKILKQLYPVDTYTDIYESATFSFRIQKCPRPRVSVFKLNLSIHTYPTHIRIHSSTQDSSGNIGNRACVVKRGEIGILLCLERTWERGYHLEYSIHGKELGSILLRHRIKISGFSVHTIPDSQRIKKFPLWKADSNSCGFVCRIHRIRADGSRIQNEKVSDSKISRYVWTGP